MSVIEDVNIADLPQSWRARLTALAAGQVAVRLEVEQTPVNSGSAHADPAFGMWADLSEYV